MVCEAVKIEQDHFTVRTTVLTAKLSTVLNTVLSAMANTMLIMHYNSRKYAGHDAHPTACSACYASRCSAHTCQLPGAVCTCHWEYRDAVIRIQAGLIATEVCKYKPQ